MDFFGGITRFAGDVWNKHVAPVLPKPAPAPAPAPAMPYGPGGAATGSGLGQARQAPPPPVPIKQKAVSDTLSYAEGTWNSDTNSPNYNKRYGDNVGEATLDISKPHPQNVRSSPWGSGFSSNASGAFQFKDDTWMEQFDGKNEVMSPVNQDRAVGQLIEGTGYDYNQPFEDQAHKLSGRWASIPNRQGVSNYGQPTPHSSQELGEFHDLRLGDLQAEEYDRIINWRINNLR